MPAVMFFSAAVPEVPGLVIFPPPTAVGDFDAFVRLSGPFVVSCWGPAASPVLFVVAFCASAFCPS
jgi:hypothetical protein